MGRMITNDSFAFPRLIFPYFCHLPNFILCLRNLHLPRLQYKRLGADTNNGFKNIIATPQAF